LVAEIIPEVWMMDHDDPLYFDMKKEKVGALTILTPSLRLLTVDSLPTIPSTGAPVAVTTLVKMSTWVFALLES
jgi:hypothetical protein